MAKAGRWPGWLDVAVQAAQPMNIARQGRVFVPAVGRDLAALVMSLADASRAVHEALLDLRE